MSRANAEGARGFTFIEVAVVGTVLSLVLGTAVVFLTSASSMSQQSRAMLRAAGDHRDDALAVGSILAGMQLATLQGDDGTGRVTTPRFQRLVRQTDGSYATADEETVAWETATGLDAPGRVVVRSTSGTSRTLATNVPADGFWVQIQGRSLLIHLTTLHRLPDGTVHRLSGHSSVATRN